MFLKERGDKDLSLLHMANAYNLNHKSAESELNIQTQHNYLQVYNVLTKIQDKKDITNKKMQDLEKDYKIRCFKRKREYLAVENECSICYRTDKLIPMECAHFYCPDCYTKLKECPLRCNS